MIATKFRPVLGTIFRGFGCALAAAIAVWLIGAAPALAALTSPSDRCFEPCTSPAARELFGTREMISHDMARVPQWQEAMARTRAQFAAARHVCAAGETQDCVPREWAQLVQELKTLPLRSQIALANDALNRHPYVTTEQNWHRAMYWETPFEFMRRGGQCQDYAIAKYELLRQAGVPASEMRMVVLHDDAIDRDHAVLVVYLDGMPMVLDILNPAIVPASSVTAYRPYFSINEDAWWYHLGAHSMAGWMQATAR
jgi:predicted transglutaminase-like cysteine proteinase